MEIGEKTLNIFAKDINLHGLLFIDDLYQATRVILI